MTSLHFILWQHMQGELSTLYSELVSLAQKVEANFFEAGFKFYHLFEASLMLSGKMGHSLL